MNLPRMDHVSHRAPRRLSQRMVLACRVIPIVQHVLGLRLTNVVLVLRIGRYLPPMDAVFLHATRMNS